MPYRIDLTLHVDRDAVAPITARQLHGGVVSIMQPDDTGHHDQVKPFSCWPLLQAATGDDAVLLRLAWLPDTPPPDTVTSAGRQWRFGSLLATTTASAITHEPYHVLAASPGADEARITLHTPTYFSRSGRDYPLPDPLLIMRGLVERWNAFAPEPLDPAAVADLARSMEIVGLDITGTAVLLDRRPDRDGGPPRDRTGIGFTGHLDLALPPRAAPGMRPLLATVMRLAAYSGVGALTTRGLGACSTSLTPHEGTTQ